MYEHKPYPKWKYHLVKEAVIIGSKDAEDSLGDGWEDSPAKFSGQKIEEIEVKDASVKKPGKKAKA